MIFSESQKLNFSYWKVYFLILVSFINLLIFSMNALLNNESLSSHSPYTSTRSLNMIYKNRKVQKIKTTPLLLSSGDDGFQRLK